MSLCEVCSQQLGIHLNSFPQLEERRRQCRFEECHVCQKKVTQQHNMSIFLSNVSHGYYL